MLQGNIKIKYLSFNNELATRKHINLSENDKFFTDLILLPPFLSGLNFCIFYENVMYYDRLNKFGVIPILADILSDAQKEKVKYRLVNL